MIFQIPLVYLSKSSWPCLFLLPTCDWYHIDFNQVDAAATGQWLASGSFCIPLMSQYKHLEPSYHSHICNLEA